MQLQITASDILNSRIELFKRKEFDFITTREGKSHIKQDKALQILTDNETEEFLYGGAAGGAKSWTGCVWLAFNCLLYPGTRWFIARKELKRLTESTLITFFKVCKEYNITGFKFNAQKNFILFSNGSRIDLLDGKHIPSDPMFERFGSTEYTGGWIEEAPECAFGLFEVLKTRIGRHLNDKYNVLAKILLTANPNKNWVYREFYKPFIQGALGGLRKFLQSLVTENPFIESGYIDRLKRTKDKSKRERLLKGNWEYDDDPNALCSYDNILAVFNNNQIPLRHEYFLTADIARLGSDKAIVAVWDGWVVVDYKVFEKSLTTEIQDCINTFRREYNIPAHQAVADEDGVGGGVVDNCGILGFTNNASPVAEEVPDGYGDERYQKPQYNNYQTQCGYYLVKMINSFNFWFKAEISEQYKEEITEELEQLKSYKVEDDRKVYLLPKKEIKENIGRSPDWRDLFLMRAHFDINPQSNYEISW